MDEKNTVNDLMRQITILQAKVDVLQDQLDVTEGLLDSANNMKSILMIKLKRVQEVVGS